MCPQLTVDVLVPVCAAQRSRGVRVRAGVPPGRKAGGRALVAQVSRARGRADRRVLQHAGAGRVRAADEAAGEARRARQLHVRGDAGLRAPAGGALLPSRSVLRHTRAMLSSCQHNVRPRFSAQRYLHMPRNITAGSTPVYLLVDVI